ncbi:CBO0543 family protein [Halalkalibacter okhensis]|uniref:Uncharacterized protein n=1 Tax=Halalkalibacter okhensis TaxID=333138 RepID=A0A0B0IH97_9BACI|nr:CBO0543 family protein [Halalkalibacter okhensis]KHF39404.1 hypothetical protein LQ50_15185 [Halalkalibacter okhensis]
MPYKKRENVVVASSCIIIILLLFNFVPRNKMREAHISFLFQQAMTWFFGLLVVEKGLIKYPYRTFFKKSNKSSFAFEFFIYPAITILFNLYYPERRSCLSKIFYICSYSGVITFLETFTEKYTDLIEYKKWNGYWSFITLSITCFISRVYYRWFFKKEDKMRLGNE